MVAKPVVDAGVEHREFVWQRPAISSKLVLVENLR